MIECYKDYNISIYFLIFNYKMQDNYNALSMQIWGIDVSICPVRSANGILVPPYMNDYACYASCIIDLLVYCRLL